MSTRLWMAVAGAAFFLLIGAAAEDAGDPYAESRAAMVRAQLVGRDITDPLVLAAMGTVPRHRFVPEALRGKAYEDTPLPIGHEQTISQPYVVALMTQAATLKGGETCLEVGTGSGYGAAVLGAICDEVYSIEIVCPLAAQAKKTLAAVGAKNVTTRCGDGYQGWPEHAPFDAVLVTAAADHVPEPLIRQLKVGGRLVMPVGGAWVQELMLLTKTKTGVAKSRLLPVRFVPLTGPLTETPSKSKD